MGAGQSSPSSTSAPPKTALHVLRIAPASPAARTGLEPFFDFIAGLDGAELVLDELERVVEANEGRTLELVVWSSKTRQTRDPSSSTSPKSARPSCPGLSICVFTHGEHSSAMLASLVIRAVWNGCCIRERAGARYRQSSMTIAQVTRAWFTVFHSITNPIPPTALRGLVQIYDRK